MKNIEEKLEIMQWLYENGMEPRNYIEVHSFGGYTITMTIVRQPHARPWYPLEQVLELLPDTINHSMRNNLPLGMVGSEFFYGDEDMKIVFSTPYTEVTSDYHLASLKLLKQVIEKYPESVK